MCIYRLVTEQRITNLWRNVQDKASHEVKIEFIEKSRKVLEGFVMVHLLSSGTHDFFGLNHYTTQYVRHLDRGIDWPSYEHDQDVEETLSDDWPT